MRPKTTKRSLGYREIAKLRSSMLALEMNARQALRDLIACKHVSELQEDEAKFKTLLRAIAIRSRRGVTDLNAIGDRMDSKHKRRVSNG